MDNISKVTSHFEVLYAYYFSLNNQLNITLLALVGWLLSLVFVAAWSICKSDGPDDLMRCWPDGSIECDWGFIQGSTKNKFFFYFKRKFRIVFDELWINWTADLGDAGDWLVGNDYHDD